MSDILVIGSLNADLVVKSPRFPEAGETIQGEDLQVISGGKGANQAVAAARQGVSVAMAGRVGNDSFAPFLIDNLKQNQVDTTHVLETSSATGTAIIVVEANGQNRIVLSAGANGKVSADDIESINIYAKILLLQLEIPLESVIHAAKWGKQKNMIVILNPAPAKELPDELISQVDFIVPNESELSLLTNIEVKDSSLAEQASQKLLERGAKNVIVTLGKNGALLVDNKQSKQINSYQVNVVDTTAAGDSFIGGFASALFKNKSIEESVKYGCACGALAVTKFGAQPSLPTKTEVENFITSNS